MRLKSRLSVQAAAIAIIAGSIFGAAGTAAAAQFDFVNIANPIPANHGYYSSRQNHYSVDMAGCGTTGTWSARVRETTGGSGAQIRNLTGQCKHMILSWWPADTDVRVWCYNQTSSPRYAWCTQYYN
jgi:hypothetical protein